MKKNKFKMIMGRALPILVVGASIATASAQTEDGADAVSAFASQVAPYGAAGLLVAAAVAGAVVGIKWVKRFIGRST